MDIAYRTVVLLSIKPELNADQLTKCVKVEEEKNENIGS